MNFTFMIYIILAIMIFMSINKKVKLSCICFCVPLFIILLLNEIYNYSEYIKKDFFTNSNLNTWNKYKYDKNFNPYDHHNDFKNIQIPFNYDSTLDGGMRCSSQSHIQQNELLKKKIMLQDNYSNQILDVISGKPFDESMTDDVFLPVSNNMFDEIKECPTVCHLIRDKEKCNTVREVPVFNSETDFDSWNNQRKACSRITSPASCNSDDMCIEDDDSNNCYSKKNLRKCFSYGDSDRRIIKDFDSKYNGMEVKVVSENPYQANTDVLLKDGKVLNIPNINLVEETECYTQCKFLNVPGDEKLTERNCKNAITSDGKNYCRIIDSANVKQCVPSCYTYKTESDCPSNGCVFDGTCKDS